MRSIIDGRHEENLTLENLQKVLMTLNSTDFTITSDEIE